MWFPDLSHRKSGWRGHLTSPPLLLAGGTAAGILFGPVGYYAARLFTLAPLPRWMAPAADFTDILAFMLIWMLLPCGCAALVAIVWYGALRQFRAFWFLVPMALVWLYGFTLPPRAEEMWGPARERAIQRVIASGIPLIEALEKHKLEKGEYPAKLDDLLPAYLSALPSTDVAMSPEFRYTRAKPDSHFLGYTIRVSLRFTLDFDDLTYYQDETDRPIETISHRQYGDWVFFDD